MPEQSFDVAAGQSIQQRNIGFPAFGLVVENITNQWYYEPLRRRYIPPYQSGASVPLIGSVSANLLCQAPGTATQATPIPGEYLTASYTDTGVVAGSGVNVGSQLALPQPLARLAPIDRRIGSATGIHIIHVMNSADGLTNIGQISMSPGVSDYIVWIEFLQIIMARATAATGAGQAYAWAQIPGGSPIPVLRNHLDYDNTVGARQTIMAQDIQLVHNPANSITETLDIECQDFNTGPAGSIIVEVNARFWSYAL